MRLSEISQADYRRIRLCPAGRPAGIRSESITPSWAGTPARPATPARDTSTGVQPARPAKPPKPPQKPVPPRPPKQQPEPPQPPEPPGGKVKTTKDVKPATRTSD